MPKILKVSFPEKCIGCEICLSESQRQLKKVGLEGSLVRVFREKEESREKITYYVQLDPQVNELNIKKIAQICPTGVFTVEESEDENELIG